MSFNIIQLDWAAIYLRWEIFFSPLIRFDFKMHKEKREMISYPMSHACMKYSFQHQYAAQGECKNFFLCSSLYRIEFNENHLLFKIKKNVRINKFSFSSNLKEINSHWPFPLLLRQKKNERIKRRKWIKSGMKLSPSFHSLPMNFCRLCKHNSMTIYFPSFFCQNKIKKKLFASVDYNFPSYQK